LLTASSSGENSLSDVIEIRVPKGKNLDYGSQEFEQYESIGLQVAPRRRRLRSSQTPLQELPFLCLILVAGGLGERLGFSDIKVRGRERVCVMASIDVALARASARAACRPGLHEVVPALLRRVVT
jgi:hypothetical protein